MDLAQFAEQYRVRTKHDECGEIIIPGKLWKKQPKDNHRPPRSLYLYGHHIFDYADGKWFGVMLMFPVDNGHEIGGSGKSAKWSNARKTLLGAGFSIKQDGDAEGVALFDPTDKAQARFALKLAGVKRRRVVVLTDTQKQALRDRLQAARARKAA